MIALTLVLHASDYVVTAEHGIIYDLDLKKVDTTLTHTKILKLQLQETADLHNKMAYALMLSYNATSPIAAYICNTDDFDLCLAWDNVHIIQNQTSIAVFESYLSKFPDIATLYVHFRGYEGTTLKAQVFTAIPLGFGMNATVSAGSNVHVVLAHCEHNFQNLISTGSKICITTAKAHPQTQTECDSVHEATFEVQFKQMYVFATLLAAAESVQSSLNPIITADVLQPNLHNTVRLVPHRLCWRLFNVDVTGDFSLVTEQTDHEQRLEFTHFLYDTANRLISDSVERFQTVHSTTAVVYVVQTTSYQTTTPWDVNPMVPVEMTVVFAKNIAMLAEDEEKTTMENQFVFDNKIADGPYSLSGYADYSLAMVMIGAQNHTASLSDKFKTHGDTCVTEVLRNDVCQLQVTELIKNQMELRQNRIIYAESSPGDSIRISKIYEINQDETFIDQMWAKTAKYYKIKTTEIDNKSRIIIRVNSQEEDLLDVSISNTFLLPQPGYNNVQHTVGTNMSIQLDQKLLGDQILYIKIVAASELQFAIQISSSDVPEVIISENMETIQLVENVEIQVAYKIPNPLISDNAITYFDAVAYLLSYKTIDAACSVSISHANLKIMELNKNVNLTSIHVNADLYSLITDSYIIIKITSDCNIALNIQATPVIIINDGAKEVTVPVAGTQLVMARELTRGIDQQVEFIAETLKQELEIWVCGHPVLYSQDELKKQCEQYISDPFDYSYVVWADSYAIGYDERFVYYTIKSSTTVQHQLLTVDESDLILVENDVHQNTIIQPHDMTIFIMDRKYNEESFYLNVDKLENSEICVFPDFNSEAVDCFLEPGLHKYDVPEKAESMLIAVACYSDVAKLMGFRGVFLQKLKSEAKAVSINHKQPRHFIYTRQNKNFDLIFSAVMQQQAYTHDIIPDEMFQKTLELYVNQNDIANRTAYVAHQAQAGPQAVSFLGALIEDDTFLITVYSHKDTTIEIIAKELRNGFSVPYGDEEWVDVDSVDTADFILDSAYSPSGATIEQCSGQLDSVYFSYYHIPSSDYSFATKVDVKSQNTGLIKAFLNSTDDRQNFFASVKTKGKASYIVRHSFTDTRPITADPTIWVPKSGNDGILTLQVDPVQYQHMTRYQAYIIDNVDTKNSTACGVMTGTPVSDAIYLQEGEKVVRITTNVALESGKNYTLNIVSFYVINGGEAVAYKPIYVWKGMKPTDPEFEGPDEGQNLTWIIWVVLGSVLVAVIIVCLLFLKKRQGYKQLVQKEKAKSVKDMYKEEVAGGLENSDH